VPSFCATESHGRRILLRRTIYYEYYFYCYEQYYQKPTYEQRRRRWIRLPVWTMRISGRPRVSLLLLYAGDSRAIFAQQNPTAAMASTSSTGTTTATTTTTTIKTNTILRRRIMLSSYRLIRNPWPRGCVSDQYHCNYYYYYNYYKQKENKAFPLRNELCVLRVVVLYTERGSHRLRRSGVWTAVVINVAFSSVFVAFCYPPSFGNFGAVFPAGMSRLDRRNTNDNIKLRKSSFYSIIAAKTKCE